MHGSVRLLVCVECGATLPLSAALAAQLRARRRIPCAACGHDAMRFKVMMYEDAESEYLLLLSVFRGSAALVVRSASVVVNCQKRWRTGRRG